jgi:hypothetical protein
MSSCKNKQINFEKNKYLYLNSLVSLNKKNKIIFSEKNAIQSISIYFEDLEKYGLCENLCTLFKKEDIEFVDYHRDSTVGFYFKMSDGIKKIQSILIYCPNKRDNMFTTDMKILKINYNNWYEIEKTISLAN